jgi:hypothetical protein
MYQGYYIINYIHGADLLKLHISIKKKIFESIIEEIQLKVDSELI